MRTADGIRRAAERAGCRVVSLRTRFTAKGPVLAGDILCPDKHDGDAWASARLLAELATLDAADPAIQRLAAGFRRLSPSLRGRAIHGWVRSRVSYTPPGEVQHFHGAAWTLANGIGSCPEHAASLVWALARAAGLPARLVFFTEEGEPVHVAAQIADGGVWNWAETTVAADYGEHPLAAVRRLGLERPDLDGQERAVVPRYAPPESETLTHPIGQPTPQSGLDLSSFNPPGYWDGGDGSVFAQDLVDACQGVCDPFDALALMLHESGLQPFADNGAAVGIFQLDPYDASFTGMDRATFKALLADGQVRFAGAWWRRMASAFRLSLPLSGRDLYWVNFLPATVVQGASDDHVIVDADDTIHLAGGGARTLTGAYTDNTILDHGHKGFISAGDMRAALQDGADSHPKSYAYLSQKIQAAGSGAPGGGGFVASLGPLAVGFGLGALGLAAWKVWG